MLQEDALSISERLSKAGADLVSLSESIDTTSRSKVLRLALAEELCVLARRYSTEAS